MEKMQDTGMLWVLHMKYVEKVRECRLWGPAANLWIHPEKLKHARNVWLLVQLVAQHWLPFGLAELSTWTISFSLRGEITKRTFSVKAWEYCLSVVLHNFTNVCLCHPRIPPKIMESRLLGMCDGLSKGACAQHWKIISRTWTPNQPFWFTWRQTHSLSSPFLLHPWGGGIWCHGLCITELAPPEQNQRQQKRTWYFLTTFPVQL